MIKTITFCVLLLGCLPITLASLTCGNISGASNSYPFEHTRKWLAVYGPIIIGGNATLDYTNSIVLLPHTERTVERTVLPHLNRGAKALILRASFSLGRGFYNKDPENIQVNVPVADITEELMDQFEKALQIGTLSCVNATLTWEDNQFYEMYEGVPFILFVMAIPTCWAIVNLAYAIYKIHLGMKERVWRSVPMTVLVCEILANISRIVYYPIDPWEAKRIYAFNVGIFIHNLQYPFALASLLLITLYWHEIIYATKEIKINAFLPKMRIYFYIACAILIGLMLLAGAMGTIGMGDLAVLNTVAWTLFSASFAVILVFYIVTGLRIANRLFKMRKPQREAILPILYKSLCICIALTFFLVVVVLHSVLPFLLYYPTTHLLQIIALTYPWPVISTLQIASLYSRKTKTSSSNSSKSISSSVSVPSSGQSMIATAH